MEAPVQTTARPRKRFRFTLGVMMALVLAIGGALGWIAYKARVQRQAVAAIRKAGGSVSYDWQYKDGKRFPNGKPRGAKWLRDAIGPDAFDTVTMVGLGGANTDDAVMAHVGRLNGLELFNFQGRFSPGLTPKGMARIGSLDRLQSFVVQGPRDTGGFLPYVGGKPKLRRLWLAQARASDEDMRRVGRLTDLQELQLDGRDVTDDGFSHLAGLKQLRQLEMRGVRITSLAPVSGLIKLTRLALHGVSEPASIPPLDLEPLRPLVGLESLMGVSTDDRGLASLATMPKLGTVAVVGRGITEAGLLRLSSAPRLAALWLDHTSVRDPSALGPVLPRLVLLGLIDSPVADDGLACLEGRTSLRSLMLQGSQVTDLGMTTVGGLSGLTGLQLIGRPITDEGLSRLRGLTGLTRLGLTGTKITDDGLRHLGGFTRLQHLDLSETNITDAGLVHLQKMPALIRVELHGTKVTDEGVTRLQKALPKARISRT